MELRGQQPAEVINLLRDGFAVQKEIKYRAKLFNDCGFGLVPFEFDWEMKRRCDFDCLTESGNHRNNDAERMRALQFSHTIPPTRFAVRIPQHDLNWNSVTTRLQHFEIRVYIEKLKHHDLVA